MALIVLIGTGLLVRSFVSVIEQDLGFVAENLWTMRIAPPKQFREDDRPPDEQRRELEAEFNRQRLFYEGLLERISSVPGVRSVAAISRRPLGGSAFGVRFAISGRPIPAPPEAPVGQRRVVSPGYFRTLGIPVLHGRTFTDADRRDAKKVVVISETLARTHWPDDQPIGQSLSMRDPIYTPLGQSPTGFFRHWGMDLMARTSDADEAVASAIRTQVEAVAPALPVFDTGSMEERVDDALAGRRFSLVLSSAFGVVSALLAAIGIYGVVAYSVSRRTREFGIRVVLGARQGGIVPMVLGQGLRLALIGVALGITGALALTRFMASMLFEVTPYDPPTFLGVGLALTLMASATCCLPALRATHVDPKIVLHEE